MNRAKKIIRNCAIIPVLILITCRSQGLCLTPLSAFRSAEKGIHYGPSVVVHTEDSGSQKYLLCKYDKWVSCTTVKRTFGLFWRVNDWPKVFENKKSQAVSYSWDDPQKHFILFGIVNDPRVKKIKLTLPGKVLTQTRLYQNMFLFALNSDVSSFDVYGYDANGNQIPIQPT